MSGVWSGWRKRLQPGPGPREVEMRPDGAALPPPDAFEPTVEPVAGLQDDPGTHADIHADIGELPMAKPAGQSKIDRLPPAKPEPQPAAMPAVAALPVMRLPSKPATPESARALLSEGAVKKAHTAAMQAQDAELAALANAIRAGEVLLKRFGVKPPEGDSGVLNGIMLAPLAGAKHLLIVFGNDNGQFALPYAVGIGQRPNLLFVRDRKQALGLLGVPRLGGDYDACLLTIEKIAAGLKAREIFCVGAGAAMYTALRFGLDLGAAGVLAMGTMSVLESGADVPGNRPGSMTANLVNVATGLGGDLGRAYLDAVQRPGLVLCRPATNSAGTGVDLATLPGTTVIRAPGGRPDLLAWADESGALRDQVTQLMARRAITRTAQEFAPAAAMAAP